MEQMRIVKEMRNEYRRQQSINGSDVAVCDIKPRYLVWENVAGAFSSGKPEGADFQAVLEEVARVVLDEVPTIPIPTDGWPYAGNLDGVASDGTPFSICWRTHDAQYWGKTIIDNSGRVVKAGTPQRRRRIALVADFGGSTAPEILFERTGMQGNPESSREKREETPGASGTGIKESGSTVIFNEHELKPEVSEAIPIYNHPQGSELSFIDDGVSQTLTARAGTGGNNTPMVFENHSQDTRYTELKDVCTTVNATYGMGGNNTPFVVEDQPNTIAIEGNGSRDSHKGDGYSESDVMYTLNTVEQHGVCYGFQGQAGASTGMPIVEEGTPTMVANQVTNVVQTSEPVLLESNQNHATVQTDGVATTLPASMGEGGGYVPMVVDEQKNEIKQEGCDLYNLKMTGEVSPTLSTLTGTPDGSGGKVLMTNVPPTYAVEPGAASRLGGHVTEEVAPTLRAEMGDNQTAVVVNVETEVSVRKYEVDVPRLIECLQAHRQNMSIKDLAATLDKPKTLVEHWFRKDKCFAIPDADIWMKLKELLKIDTDEFDKSIMTFETKAGSYDTSNRIHMGNVTPTLTASGENTMYCVEQEATVYGISSYDSNAMKSDNPESGIYKADTARTLDLNGGNPACNQGGMMVVQPEKPIRESVKSNEPICVQRRFSSANVYEYGVTPTLEAGAGEGGNNMPLVMDNQIQDVTGTLGARTYKNSSVQEAETNMFVITPEVNAQTFKKDAHAKSSEDGQGWVATDVNDTLNAFDNGETRTPTLITQTYQDTTGALCASGYEKNGTQEAANDMYVVQEATAWDGGQISSTLTANNADGSQRMPDKDHFNAVITFTPDSEIKNTAEEVAFSMLSRDYKDPQCVAIDMGGGKSGCGIHEEKSPTLTTTHGGEPAICGIDTYNLQETGDVGRTVTAAGGGLNEHTPCVYEKSDSTYGVSGTSSKFGVGKDLSPAQTAAHPNMVSTTSVVRRLTPGECEALQGFPRGWTDIGEWVDENGKKHKPSDSPRYKALGNSIALPFWDWMAGRMCDQLRKSGVEQPKLMSLFDGISGFCLVFARHGCTPLLSSEIEQFPIAVAKKHFGDDATGDKGDYEQYL